MSASQEQRKEVSQEIKAKFEQAKSIVFVKSCGLTVAEDTELRRAFRKSNVEYKVYKNTLIRYALHELGITEFDDDLNGPTSVAFGTDETGASKIILDASKKLDSKFEIKSGYVDGTKIDAAGVKALATMPSKEELIAKMLGSLQSPISKFAGVLSAIPRGLVIALNQIAEKKA